ncbi:MAG TPA: alpha-galactosidase [Candidatus Latescibacteria bacterium]|nr:alpha-galactosidase [Candidatus Latescibacterota bacterium]
MKHETTQLEVTPTGTVGISCPSWPGFAVRGLSPALRVDGADLKPRSAHVATNTDGSTVVEYRFREGLSLTCHVEPWRNCGYRFHTVLHNNGGTATVLNNVVLLGTDGEGFRVAFGAADDPVRVMEQGNYWGKVRPLSAPKAVPAENAQGEPNEAPGTTHGSSDFVWVAYNQASRMAFLAGFLSSERWSGRISVETAPGGEVLHWGIGFDGADVLLKPHSETPLEDLLFLVGADPWELLASYAGEVQTIHNPQFPAVPPVSWCSWYAYRLGVSEERILENARIAAQRLKPLGLGIIELDLGWEAGNLPSTFEENERFPHGLKWLSEELAKLGFDMGVWKAPFTISEFDPMAKEYPEYLIQGEDGKPAPYWDWFWEPHGKVFILDLTHPGAQAWLREKMTSLAERGVKYLKSDFIGCVTGEAAKRRHNPDIAAGGGLEAARIGARIIRECLPDALQLNCGGPEMPGTGHWPLLYTVQDTGNTGFIGHSFQRDNYQAAAVHLFKNYRWGILQPSCLCVGAPGTLDDARLRATIAFLTGGQVDISDTLTTLPEDRWAVLTATLPPLGITAKAVDLFDPVYAVPFDYEAICRGEASGDATPKEHPPGSVWKLHVKTDWDEWDLVGVFSYSPGASAETPAMDRFSIPFSMLEIPPESTRWGYEFWSGQFIGTVPGKRTNDRGYVHPGDYQDLTVGDAPGVLEIAFFGPCVKLLALRAQRPHPWVVGTSFHQSCGAELHNVAWDATGGVLSGEVHRPVGETGFVALSTAGMATVSCRVDGIAVPHRTGANGSLILPVTMNADRAEWQGRFG